MSLLWQLYRVCMFGLNAIYLELLVAHTHAPGVQEAVGIGAGTGAAGGGVGTGQIIVFVVPLVGFTMLVAPFVMVSLGYWTYIGNTVSANLCAPCPCPCILCVVHVMIIPVYSAAHSAHALCHVLTASPSSGCPHLLHLLGHSRRV